MSNMYLIYFGIAYYTLKQAINSLIGCRPIDLLTEDPAKYFVTDQVYFNQLMRL